MITRNDIEQWARDAIKRASSRQQTEDDFVELKSEWPPDYRKTARQLAGHANAARGEPILWLIGVDEKTGKILGAPVEGMAEWFAQVQRHFDSTAPTPRAVSFQEDKGSAVVAILFETDQRPFVVRTGAAGGVEYEVPWHSARSTRSARRPELLEMSRQVARRPRIEMIRAMLRTFDAGKGQWALRLEAELFIEPGESPAYVRLDASELFLTIPGVDDDRTIIGRQQLTWSGASVPHAPGNVNPFPINQPGYAELIIDERSDVTWSAPTAEIRARIVWKLAFGESASCAITMIATPPQEGDRQRFVAGEWAKPAVETGRVLFSR